MSAATFVRMLLSVLQFASLPGAPVDPRRAAASRLDRNQCSRGSARSDRIDAVERPDESDHYKQPNGPDESGHYERKAGVVSDSSRPPV